MHDMFSPRCHVRDPVGHNRASHANMFPPNCHAMCLAGHNRASVRNQMSCLLTANKTILTIIKCLGDNYDPNRLGGHVIHIVNQMSFSAEPNTECVSH